MEKRMSNQREDIDKHLILSGFFPEESTEILRSDIKIKGSKRRIRREHRFERILKQVQKMQGATRRRKLMAVLNKTSAEKEKQHHASKKGRCSIK